jgi:uncharacterized protein YbcI
MTSEGPASEADPAERISGELAALHHECYGEDVRDITTYLLEDAVLCVIELNLLVHERTLLGAGVGGDAIIGVRKAFQETIGATFVATVEHMTGRRVVGFISDTHLDPPFSIEFFRLAPEEELPPEPP